jgi:uncharacterized membrane protein YvlD (DUF360 family)
MVTTLAVVLAATISGVRIENWGGLLGVAFFVGLVNALARPLLLRWAAHFIVPALIIAIVVINLALLGGLNWVPELRLASLGNGLFAAAIVTVVSCLFSLFFRDHEGRIHLITHHPVVKEVRSSGAAES